MEAPKEDLLGRLAVQRGMITQAQLDLALRAQAERRGKTPLAGILIEKGLLTPKKLGELMDLQKKVPSETDRGPGKNAAGEPPPSPVAPGAGKKPTNAPARDSHRRLAGASLLARWIAVAAVAALVVVASVAWRRRTSAPPPAETSHDAGGVVVAAVDSAQAEFDALKAFLSAHESDPLACIKRIRDAQSRYAGMRVEKDLSELATRYEGRINAPGEPIFREEVAQAAALEKEDRFGDAVEALVDPPADKDPLLYWSMKLAHERGLVPGRARQRWDAIAAEAEALATAGKWEEAFASAERGERLGIDEVTSLVKGRVADFRVRQQAALVAAEHAGELAAEAKDERRIGLVVAEWPTCVRRFRFSEAAEGYERCLAEFRSAKWKKELESRLEVARSLAALEKRFFDRVNEGKVRDLAFQVGEVTVTITRAIDEEYFECKFPGGAGRAAWSTLGTEALFGHLEDSSPTPAERLALGALAWDLGFNDLAVRLLIRALQADETLAPRIDRVVSERRGIPVPAEGFIVWRGRFVTLEEKTNLEKGLVLFEGQWVTPADREMLARGMQKIGDKWLPRDEAELAKLGYHKWKGKWYSKEEYAAIRSKWDSAYEAQTDHYDIRTNASQEFADELAKVAEADYAELKVFYGGKEPKLPAKEKMTLYAYAAYEDYKKYCVENHAEAELQAAGFATSGSLTVVGWDKAHDRRSFLETMSHEAAHLYYFKSVGGRGALASWYAEGMATQFEGFHKKGAGYEFDRRAASRIWFLKQAVASNKQLPLDQLVSGDAISLINTDPGKALVFYAECWGLVYFLTHPENGAFAKGFQSYRDAADGGSAAELGGFVDMRALEAEFLEYVKKL